MDKEILNSFMTDDLAKAIMRSITKSPLEIDEITCMIETGYELARSGISPASILKSVLNNHKGGL